MKEIKLLALGDVVRPISCDYLAKNLWRFRKENDISAVVANGENSSENGGIDRERCLSAVTQRKGEPTPEEEKAIRASGCIWGCDVCQEVCPMNRGVKSEPIGEFTSDCVFSLTGETPIKNRAFGWRGRGVINRNLEIISGKNNDK